MPFRIEHLGTYWGGPLEMALRGDLWQTAEGPILLDEALGRRLTLTLDGDGTPEVTVEAFAPAERVGVLMPSGPASLSLAALQAASNGDGTSRSTYLSEDADPASHAHALVVRVEAASVLLLASSDGAGVVSYILDQDGGLSGRRVLPDSSVTYLADVSAMLTLEIGGRTLVYVASGTEPGLGAFTVAANGSLAALDHIGMTEGLPVSGISALAEAEAGGKRFLLVGAAGSDSLSVLALGTTGEMTPVDHVLDTQATRFGGITHLRAITIEGRCLVVAVGADDGISLLELLPNGRLIHLHSLPDAVNTALQNPDWLTVSVDPTGLNVVIGSQVDAGLSQFRVDLSALGIAAIANGGPGRDIVTDTAGSDTRRGGGGADLFVPTADGRADHIADFQLGLDLLDLSLWPMFRGLHQLGIEETPTGLRLSFGNEVLTVSAVPGVDLRAIHLWQILSVTADRVPILPGSIQIADQPPPVVQLTPPPPPAINLPQPTESDEDLSDGPPPSSAPPEGVSVTGGSGRDLLVGTALADALSAQGGDDTLRGLDGNDTLAGGSGNDSVDGGSGNDLIGGGTGHDRLTGGDGNDTVGGGFGNDRLEMDAGHDVGAGGPGDDTIQGGVGNDTLAGSFGNDSLEGGGGDDRVGGGPGRDTLLGDLGSDQLGGGEGDDWLDAGPGNDFVAGGGRDDTLMAGAGRDTLNGGAGNDRMTGGAGPDVFVFNALVPGERDVITDFQPGQDLLRISGVTGSGQTGRFLQLDIDAFGTGTRIAYAGHEIILSGVAPSLLDRDDFAFL